MGKNADSAARAAVEIADLVLIPCRPSAFELSAIQTTAKLVQLPRKPAFVVFTAGNPNAPRIYQKAGELIEGFGTPSWLVQISDRAAYRHASDEGRTVMEYEPDGKAADDIRQIYEWTCRQSACRCRESLPARGAPHEPQTQLRQSAQRRARRDARTRPGSAGRRRGREGSAPATGPASRQGRKQIAGFFSPEMSFAMHMLARRQGRSLQALMAEAFNDVLRKHGESPIGD